MVTEQELKRALCLFNEQWQRQNDELDKLSEFVYEIDNLDFIIKICKVKNIDLNYALHRWYNFQCAQYHEFLFCKNGAVKENDKRHKTIDFYINKVPFDLKTSVYPKKFRQNLNLNLRENKNELIRWLYQNQSSQGRQHFDNRLFLICQNLDSKSNLESIELKIKAFLDYSQKNGFNKIEINNNLIFSDIIWVKKNN